MSDIDLSKNPLVDELLLKEFRELLSAAPSTASKGGDFALTHPFGPSLSFRKNLQNSTEEKVDELARHRVLTVF